MLILHLGTADLRSALGISLPVGGLDRNFFVLKTHHVAVFLEPISKKPGQEGRRNTGAVAKGGPATGPHNLSGFLSLFQLAPSPSRVVPTLG